MGLCALPLWGWLQLALGATEYRYATVQSALQLSAFSATAWIAYASLDSEWLLRRLLVATTWFGFLASIASVLAYYTSPGQVLWLIDARYPDVWGPFLSRNNFAQFIEICLPPALWLAFAQPERYLYWVLSAVLLAAGLASASRGGAVLLVLEALAAFALAPGRVRSLLPAFLSGAAFLAVCAGAQTLVGRWASDPLAERSLIYQSTLAMISERPWQGYGLGTFASVYPEFALFDSGYSINHAHNDWLEWASEGGVGFAAAWAGLFLPSLRRIRTQFWALGIPAVLLHALGDFPMARTGIAAWVFLLLGALERTPPQPTDRRTT